MPVECVLFDLDGTLIDTTDLIFRSYQHALAAVLGEAATPAELLRGYGRPLKDAFPAILAARGVQLPAADAARVVERLIAAYRAFNLAEHDRLGREFPGVRPVLAELRRRGYALGLVTSKARSIGERGLRLIGIADIFDTAVYLEDSDRHKPNPDPLWVALDRLGFRATPVSALYVGDSTHDLLAGRAAGAHTAAALWGPFPRESLLALAPDYALTTIADLLPLLPGRTPR